MGLWHCHLSNCTPAPCRHCGEWLAWNLAGQLLVLARTGLHAGTAACAGAATAGGKDGDWRQTGLASSRTRRVGCCLPGCTHFVHELLAHAADLLGQGC